jgi:hypothetical protein
MIEGCTNSYAPNVGHGREDEYSEYLDFVLEVKQLQPTMSTCHALLHFVR